MTVFFPNVDPLYIYRRKSDEYLSLKDTNNVQYKTITMKEIPLYSNGVVAKDSQGIELNEVRVENDEWYDAFPLDINEYRIDYSVGVAFFNEERDGEEITLEYTGTGYVNIPSSRIIMPRGKGEPIQTLQEALDRVSDAVTILGEVGEMKFVREYSETIQYRKWNFVYYKNKTYVALSDVAGESPESSSKWQLVSSGVGYADIYNSEKIYNVGDMVSDLNSKNLYMSKIDNNSSPLSDVESWSKMLSLDGMVEKVEMEISKLNNLKQTMIESDEQRNENETQRDVRVDAKISELDTIADNINSLEQERQTQELTRANQEQTRKDSEGQRTENENLRENREVMRQQAEATRKQEFSQLVNDVNTVIEEAELVASETDSVRILTEESNNIAQASINQMQVALDDISEWKHLNEYNSEANYKKLNMVKYDGGTYMALQDSFNIEPTNQEYWVEIAKAGNDGTSITIEGVSADENGNISLGTLNLVRNDDLQRVENTLNKNVGDLSALQTLEKTSLVGAINELKRKIDDLISVLP